MGILDKYNKVITQSGGNTKLIRNPNTPTQSPDSLSFNQDNFKGSSLDLENPLPLGGPINVSYTTLVGEDIVTSPTTQPYTPKSTYTDSFTDPRLIARTIDPIK
tara:strand:+ start:50 stop:361 length:312 start_codon:yes stop_codon:yes gene_type:complete